MGSLNPDAESKQELDDSGYVQDDTASKQAAEEYKGMAELLDLSDDVLLYILRYCSPQDLKALGFSCARLGALVLDRTLWVDVDAGGTQHGRRRVRWLLAQALGPYTRRLRLGGYAKEAEGCLGFVNRYDLSESRPVRASQRSSPPEEERYLCGGPRVYRLTQTLPRYGGGFPYWPHAGASPAQPPLAETTAETPPAPDGCPGPQLTLTHTGLRELTALCTGLRTLELEDCVIDCQTTNIGMFPKTLTKLSLKGTKCFNLESKSFLFKIQDHLTHLEELDVSYCSWIEPACMLPLSKMPCLRTLAMRECHKLAEFVAYASLATRYGFKKLKYLDLRGSPVGDSEVSALGWLPSLEELYLSPSRAQKQIKEHAHYSQDLLPAHTELEEWEETEPDYFKTPQISEDEWVRDEENVRGNRTRYYTTNSDDPSACILLERMIAEPVAPEEYSQVYHQFLAGHNSNIPLANPEEYREAYRQYMARPNNEHPPTGYSLFIRKPEDARRQRRNEPTPAKRRKHDHAEPGTSREADAKPSTSSDEPGPSTAHASAEARPTGSEARPTGSEARPTGSEACPTGSEARPTGSGARPTGSGADQARKRDSDDSSDDDSPPSKRACAESDRAEIIPDDKAKKDSRGPKKSSKKAKVALKKKKKEKLPRRVFEITINELNALELLVPPDVANNRAGEANNVENDANNANGADNVKNEDDNVNNEVNNDEKEDSNVNNDGENVNKKDDNNGVNNVEMEYDNVSNEDEKVKKESDANNKTNNVNNEEDSVNNGADNVNKESNVQNNVNNDDNKVNNEADNVNEGNNDNNEENNSTNRSNNDTNGCKVTNEAKNVDNKAKNDNNGADDPNNEANDANDGVERPIGEAIFDAVNNILNNEPIINYAAGNNANDGAPNSRSQRLFQFRQYRRPIVIEEFINACEEPVGTRRPPRGVLFSGALPGAPVRLDHSALVSDSAIHRFGRAIGENINYIHIGGGGVDVNARPDRSSLRVLSVTGFRRVTDASLTHLATAAPQLRALDVSRTAVTASALASFRAMRPDVHVTCDPLSGPTHAD